MRIMHISRNPTQIPAVAISQPRVHARLVDSRHGAHNCQGHSDHFAHTRHSERSDLLCQSHAIRSGTLCRVNTTRPPPPHDAIVCAIRRRTARVHRPETGPSADQGGLGDGVARSCVPVGRQYGGGQGVGNVQTKCAALFGGRSAVKSGSARPEHVKCCETVLI